MGGDETTTDDCALSLMARYKGKEKGGFRAVMFVYVLVALENMGFIANAASMVLYFMSVMQFNLSGSANTLTTFMGSTFLLSIVGGFISDTYLSRLHTCLIFGCVEILGLIMMTIQAYSKDLQPEPCGQYSCLKGNVAVMFYASLSLLALGSGGVRGALPALGADQFDQNDPKQTKSLATFFNWLLLSTTFGACIGVTGIVYLSMNVHWYWGFFVSTMVTFIGFVILAIGKPFYRLQAPAQSPIIRITQVLVVAFKNRKLTAPENPEELHDVNEEGSAFFEEKVLHTNQFSFFDKAAILQKGSDIIPWKICTVTQVEEVKVLTRMLPILASTIIMNTCLAQLQTFSIEQGYTMDPYLGSLKVPAPSIPVIPLAFMTILIPIYEFFFVPFARKITNHPSGITQLQRVGVGLVLSAISMAVAGIVEVKRRNQANKDLYHPISIFWLSFHYAIFGIADMFTLVGLLEFFYREAPVGMRSLSTSFTWLSLSFGYFLSSIFVSLINSITAKLAPSKLGWLHGLDINKNNVNLFYWFLAILSCINFFNYLYWASWYKYKAKDTEFEVKPPKALDEMPIVNEEKTQDDASVIVSEETTKDDGLVGEKKEMGQDDESKKVIGESIPDLKEDGKGKE